MRLSEGDKEESEMIPGALKLSRVSGGAPRHWLQWKGGAGVGQENQELHLRSIESEVFGDVQRQEAGNPVEESGAQRRGLGWKYTFVSHQHIGGI